MSTKILALMLVVAAAACAKKKGNYGYSPDSSAPVASNQPAASPPPGASPAKGKGKPASTAPVAQPVSAPSQPFDGDLSALEFPKPPKDAQGKDLIHVKVFPHALARGAGETPTSVKIVGNCKLFKGAANKPARGGGGGGAAGKQFDLTIAKLKVPVWLECSEPAQVVRGSDKINHRYEGAFYVHKAQNKKGQTVVEVINVVPIETYLRGVVPSEVIPSWPAEVLKAQAIAARTYAYYNIAHNPIDYDPKIYDVDDTSFFQAYSGLTNVYPATDKAIEDTAEIAMSYGNKVILSFFNTDAGGHTESAHEVFTLKLPYLKAKKEAHDVGKTKSAWIRQMPLAEATLALNKAKLLPNGAAIKDVQIAPSDLTAGKRVRAMSFVLSNGQTKKIESADFKRLLDLKSGMFTAKVAGGKLVIDGKGSGHGVGMSQVGAKELAAMGWDHRKILSFYYDSTKLCALDKARDGFAKCGQLKTAQVTEPKGFSITY